MSLLASNTNMPRATRRNSTPPNSLWRGVMQRRSTVTRDWRHAVGEPTTTVVVEPPPWVLLHVEAQARGFKNALAFRRWLRRHHVPVRRDGHRLWVRRGDVDRAIEGLGLAAGDAGAAPDRAAISDAVAAVTRRH